MLRNKQMDGHRYVWVLVLVNLGILVPSRMHLGRAAAGSRWDAALVSQVAAYEAKGQYEQALPLARRVLAERERVNGAEHPDVAAALNTLGRLYLARAAYDQAQPLLQRGLALRERLLGPVHPDVAESMNNLAVLHGERGAYERAASLLQRAMAIWQQAQDQPRIAWSLSNLAWVYGHRGEYERAASLLQRALALRERTLGPVHPDVAWALNNLAALYAQRGQHDRAMPLVERARAILQTARGPAHPDVAWALNNLAALYQARGDARGAQRLLERALDIWRATLGPAHPDVARSLCNLAALRWARGDHRGARSLYGRAVAMFVNTLGADHALVAKSLLHLAQLQWLHGDHAQALDLRQRALAIRERNLAVLLATGSEAQKHARMATLRAETYETVWFHLHAARANTWAAQLALETILRRKGRVLDTTAGAIQALRWRMAPADRARLDQRGQLRSQLARHILLGPGRDRDDYHRGEAPLRRQIAALQADLRARSGPYRTATQPVDLAQVQAQLTDDAALVELFLYYPPAPRPRATAPRWGAPRYAAYVLGAHGPPRAVDLGDSAAIDAAVHALRAALQARLPTAQARARAVEQQVMAPLRPLLGTATHLFVAPDGDLNLLPFAALVDETGQYLLERYQITYLASGRDLRAQTRPPQPSHGGVVVVANPHFDAVLDGPGAAASTGVGAAASGVAGTVVESAGALSARAFFGIEVAPLPATAHEAQALHDRLADVAVWTGRDASESRLKQLPAPRILHIATHGIWLPQPPLAAAQSSLRSSSQLSSQLSGPMGRPVAQTAMGHPLVRSGLALAGFNSGDSRADDGFLTALEVASMDLLGTQLVVLSACDTGLGEIQAGYGVFGLRRALVIAGAQTQVMSLWKVEDTATKDLMIRYYDGLLAGQGRSEAMRNAQLALRHGAETAHPYFWASFIVSGNPAPVTGLVRRPAVSSADYARVVDLVGRGMAMAGGSLSLIGLAGAAAVARRRRGSRLRRDCH